MEDQENIMTDDEAKLEEAKELIKESKDRVNSARLDHRNAIADAADEAMAAEFDADLEVAETAADDAEGLEQDDEPEENTKTSRPTIKVNGVEVELTDELIRKAQMISATEAARMLQQSKNPQRPSTDVARNPAIHQDAGSKVEDIDFAEVATALQTGTTEEVTNALKKLANRGVSQQEVFEKARDAVRFEEATSWFNSEFEDLTSDPFLRSLVIQEDDRLRAEGFEGSFKDRFKQVGETVRTWKQSISGTVAPEAADTTLSKKERLPTRTATAAKKQAPRDVEEGEEDQRSIIAEMAKKRRGY